MVLQGHVTKKAHYISTTRVPMATKLGRMVIYLDGILSLKSKNPLITWSCHITWQTKTIISPLLQWPWPPNVVAWWLTLKDSYRLVTRSFNVWSCLITSQSKRIISLLLQNLWPPNLARWWYTMKSYHS